MPRISLLVRPQYSGWCVDGVTVPMVEWLGAVLLPKILQWAQETSLGGAQLNMKQSLIPLDKYSSLYLEMKEKYGNSLIKVSDHQCPYLVKVSDHQCPYLVKVSDHQ